MTCVEVIDDKNISVSHVRVVHSHILMDSHMCMWRSNEILPNELATRVKISLWIIRYRTIPSISYVIICESAF